MCAFGGGDGWPTYTKCGFMNNFSHRNVGQNTTFADSFLANIGYILDFLQIIYGLLCHYYEPNGV